jgi:hypothetical protein
MLGEDRCVRFALGEPVETEPGSCESAYLLLNGAVVPGDLLPEPQTLARAVLEVAVDGPVGA